MKNISCLLICLLLLACGQGERTETKTEKDTTKQAAAAENSQEPETTNPNSVAAIKQAYATSVNLIQSGQLDSVSYNYNCQQERSGKIVYFSKNGKLMMIKHSYNEYSHFEATDQYFVNDNQLYFAHLNSLVWSFVAGEGDGATKDDITESRLYVVDNHAILCLEKKFTIRKNAKDNPKAENVPNKVVNCKPVNGLLKDFDALVSFKDKGNKDCLGK
ncbi:hypothetical protein EZ428_13095 [Pedobacter frigiditerrae]|uniref:Uncharacterized protein n=1 Tax=Pedobacter frigiditerrae TaxID=2530452 RepID=A0A4R0MT40_9SPHI|nr:hypothetical protein [Pedobacter frigiditerrae]TCC90211.1 hypothetical protein EZ428_13095 [Pedobacter frigiditerrae]